MSTQQYLSYNPLSLQIERLGPIRKSKLRLGDITLFLGRPNTGKSYVLRAIYSTLAPLDPYFLSQIKKFLINALTERLIRTNEIHNLDVCIEEVLKGGKNEPCRISLQLKPSFPRLVADSLRFYGRIVAGKYYVNRPSLDKIITGILEDGLEGEKTEEVSHLIGKESASRIHVNYKIHGETLKINVEVIPPNIELPEEEYNEIMAFLGFGPRNYSRAIAKIIIEEIMEKVPEAVRSRYIYNTVAFLTYGRGLLSRFLERPSQLETIERLLARTLGVEVASTIYKIKKGYEKWLDIQEGRGEEWSIKMAKSFEPLLEGRLISTATKIPYYKDWSGAETPLTLSSALVGEYVALLYSALASKDGLLLIEEPESQLHPSAQIAMAILLAALPNLCGCHVAASTHSDLLALTLSYIAFYHPSSAAISQLLESTMPHAKNYKEGLSFLSQAASTLSLENLKIYYFERDGGYTEIRQVNPEELMSGVPGIKETLGALAKWVGQLEWGQD